MFASTVDRALRQFQRRRNPAALATVFDRTAPELLALARHLCRGASGASPEDVVQATFLTVLERIDAYDPARRALPWLVGILTNRAREARRQPRHAPSGDAAAVEPEAADPAPDPLADAAGRELDGTVRDLVSRMPEAYRPVLRLHLTHGMNAQEIAAALERPAGTVRAQLARGLARLRRALPRGLAAGAAAVALGPVRAAVLQAAHAPASTAPLAALSLGAVVMLHKTTLTAGLAVAALLALSWLTTPLWWDADTNAPAASPSLASSALSTPDRASPRADADGAVLRTAARTPTAGSTAPVAEDVATTGAVTVRVVDESRRQPVAGIGVGLQTLASLRDMGFQPEFVATDAAGAVTLDGLAPGDLLATLDRGGMGRMVTIVAGRTAEVELLLDAGVTVSGRVTHADGRPAAGAVLLLHAQRMGATPLAVADGAGEYRIASLAPRNLLQAQLPGRQPSPPHRIDGAPGAAVRLDLRLRGPGHTLRGRVLDARGRAVANARVLLIPEDTQGASLYGNGKTQPRPLYVRADDRGAFACDQLPAAAITVLARGTDPAFAPGIASLDLAGAATPWLDVTLPAGARLAGRITRGGRSAGGLSLQVYAREASQWANLLGMRTTETDAEGRYEVFGILAGGAQMTVTDGPEVVASTELALTAGAVARWDADLDPATESVVRVAPPLDPVSGRPWLVRIRSGVDRTANIAPVQDGEARVNVPAVGGPHFVEVLRLAGQEPSIVIAARPIATGEVVTLRLGQAELTPHSLDARVVTPDGSPAAHLAVTLRAQGEAPFSLRAATDAEGRLTVPNLPAGTYRLRAKLGRGEVHSDPFAVAAHAGVGDIVLAPTDAAGGSRR